MPDAFRDSTFWGLLLIGLGLLLAALVFYRMDAAFLERATLTEAVVIDKTERSGGGDSADRRTVRYEWPDPERPGWTHQGAASFSGGEEAFDDLVLGEATVRIAWFEADDGRTMESRLVEGGFTGIPWPMLIIGSGLLIAAPVRFLYLRRKSQGNGP